MSITFFAHFFRKNLIITPNVNLKYKFKLNLYQTIYLDKEKEDIKAQRKKLNEEKQFLIIQLYKCMLKNKSFILPNFIRYNSRYDKEFNYYALMVPYEYLDIKHIFLKLMYSKFFNYNWRYFLNNYDRLEYYLKNNLSARQMLISFVSRYGKINKLWKNKRFKWIIQETPYFYLRILKVIRYLNEDNLKKFHDFSQSIYCNNISFSSNLLLTISSSNNINRELKEKTCRKKKRVYKRKSVTIKVGNGMLNSTMSVVNLFNNKPAEYLLLIALHTAILFRIIQFYFFS